MPPKGRLCDVGCGYGSTLRYLAKSVGWGGIGFTVSPRQADFAKSQNSSFPDVEVVCQDWMESELGDASVDGLVAIESTEHMPSFEKFLSQSYRVLKPGKRMALAVWLRDPASPKFLDRWLNDFIVSEGRLARMMYTDDLTQSVAKAFRIVSIRDVSRQVRRTWWHCAKRVFVQFFRSAEFRKRCFDPKFENRIFAITVFRILLSYYLGSMRYYILVAEKS